jgi:predicted ATPase/DNA-binding XRE family transcriptional regulator
MSAEVFDSPANAQESDRRVFGRLLRGYRRAAGISQEALAERAQISSRTVASLEQGTRQRPRVATLALLSDALSLSNHQRLALEQACDRHRRPPRERLLRQSITGMLPALIGRDQELDEVIRLFTEDEARLVTLVGPPGVGKTSLALAAAYGLSPSFTGGVTAVDLVTVTDPAMVALSIVARLELRDAARSPLAELESYFGKRSALLVLDNFEQVLPALREVRSLLQVCPTLKILITSREPLHMREEVVYRVPSLPVPNPERLPPLAELARVPSVALFVARAIAVSQDFRLTERNARSVAELCLHLDGLPLAIELAAARTSVLSPSMLLQRLSWRLSLLTSASADLPVRHQTLRAAIEWSYNLLGQEEQALLRRLAMFSGGFTLEATEAICPSNIGAEGYVVAGLASLVAKSLLLSEEDSLGRRRFRLLESIRAFALEQLLDRGEKEAAERAHVAYFLDFAEDSSARITGDKQNAWFQQMRLEEENVRTALRWCSEHQEGETLLRLVLALEPFWGNRWFAGDEISWLKEAVALVEEGSSQGLARALTRLGALLSCGDSTDEACDILTQALDSGRLLADHGVIARSLTDLARLAARKQDYASARPLLVEALTEARQTGDPVSIGNVAQNLGAVALLEGNRDEAIHWTDEALFYLRPESDTWPTTVALQWLVIGIGSTTHAGLALADSLSGPELIDLLRSHYLLDVAALSTLCLASSRVEPHQPSRFVDAVGILWRPSPSEEWLDIRVHSWLSLAASERGDSPRTLHRGLMQQPD